MLKLGYLKKRGELFYTNFNPYTNQFRKEKEDNIEAEVDNLLGRMKE